MTICLYVNSSICVKSCVPSLFNRCGFLSHVFPCRLSVALPECFQLKQLPVWRGRGLAGSPSPPPEHIKPDMTPREAGGAMLCT